MILGQMGIVPIEYEHDKNLPFGNKALNPRLI